MHVDDAKLVWLSLMNTENYSEFIVIIDHKYFQSTLVSRGGASLLIMYQSPPTRRMFYIYSTYVYWETRGLSKY